MNENRLIAVKWFDGRHGWLLLLAMFIFSIILWLPAIYTPFWGDDYFFLQAAHKARLVNDSWWLPFWPETRAGFWRPLSMETYFRFVEEFLNANALFAHIANFVLWVFSCIAVGVFAAALAQALHWSQPLLFSAIAGCVYSLSGTHFLVIHWVAAANSSFLVLWTALALAIWITAPTCRRIQRISLCALLPLLQLLALFSKESSVLIPLLFLCVSLFISKQVKFGLPEVIAWFFCVVFCIVWYFFYLRFTGARDENYELVVGANIIQNTLALIAWLLNVPREALRLTLTGDKVVGISWAISVALPMLGFFYIAGGAIIKILSVRQSFVAVVIVPLAYAPYFLLASQSYEYYAAVAMIFPMVLLARGLMISKYQIVAAGLLCISSGIAIQGSRELSYPGLMGRVEWAEQQLNGLIGETIQLPLAIQVSNQHQFYAIGIAGLAWRLGIAESDIVYAESCPVFSERMLVQNKKGDFVWQNCD
jgi:hypothetical protein